MGAIWITGAAGFTGRHLAANLRRETPTTRLIGLGRSAAALDELDAYHQIDITNSGDLRNLAEKEPPHFVFHLAGELPPAPENKLWQTNVTGTKTLITSIAATASRGVRILITSSAAVYPDSDEPVNEQSILNPANAYGRSKQAQEEAALDEGRLRGIDVVIARTFNLIGPNISERSLPGRICDQCTFPENGPITAGNLSSYRDFIDVRDATVAYHLIAMHGKPAGVYNVCSGHAVQMRRMVRELINLSPAPQLKIEEDTHTSETENYHSCGDNSRLRALGWEPKFEFIQSLEDMLAHSKPYDHDSKCMHRRPQMP
jgi:GDP-4-dehydro-6-deoxy-D-mannose reductase